MVAQRTRLFTMTVWLVNFTYLEIKAKGQMKSQIDDFLFCTKSACIH